ncbi:MAG: hypothetical protein HYX51_02160 [Chloroflexi bacterium]|nr:hypothetical protein [Chloroflexota bacterium]
MPESRPLPTFTRRFQLRAAALVLGIAVLPSAACGYQLALQPTTTPAGGPLGVRQITPQAKQVDPAALVAQAAPAQAQPNAPLIAAAAPAAPAAVQVTPARPALSLTTEPASVRAAPSDQPAPTQSAAVAPPTVPSRTNSQTLTPATATPMPSFTVAAPTRTPTATPTPRPTEAPRTATPAPAASPRPGGPVQVSLVAGTNDFLYVGATLPADRALASLAGFYDVIYFKPAGSAEQVAYRPGIDAVPTLPNNTLVRIGMKRAMSFVMTPAQ